MNPFKPSVVLPIGKKDWDRVLEVRRKAQTMPLTLGELDFLKRAVATNRGKFRRMDYKVVGIPSKTV